MNYNLIRTHLLFFTILIILLICASQTQAEETQTTIICTNSALADFTKNLITENVTIDYIMPSGACPALYDTTPSDVSKITSADILITLGSTKMEGWLTDLLEYNTDCHIIECTYMGEWNLPSNAKKYVEKIRDELTIILPDLNQTIQGNADKYMIEIDNTSENLQNLISEAGYLDKTIICMNWQEDFLTWLGLNLTYAYGPPERLSAQDMTNITKIAQNSEIFAIVDNLQSGTEFGADLASKSGASHVIFTNFPGAIPGTDTYIDMISYNTNKLIDGIATYEYKQGEIAQLESNIENLELQRNIILFGIFILAILVGLLFILYKRK